MSKNNLREITLVRGPLWGIHSLTLIISWCEHNVPGRAAWARAAGATRSGVECYNHNETVSLTLSLNTICWGPQFALLYLDYPVFWGL